MALGLDFNPRFYGVRFPTGTPQKKETFMKYRAYQESSSLTFTEHYEQGFKEGWIEEDAKLIFEVDADNYEDAMVAWKKFYFEHEEEIVMRFR